MSFASFGQTFLSSQTICQSNVMSDSSLSPSVTWLTSTGSTSYQWIWYKLISGSWTPVHSNTGTGGSYPISTVLDTGSYKVAKKQIVTPFAVIDSNFATLTLVPSAIPGIIIGTDTICNGSSITLYDTTFNGDISSSGWNVINTNGTLSATGLFDSVTFTGSNAGTDTVIFTVTSFSTFGSCGIDTSIKIITIQPTNAGIISGSDTVCQDTTSIFTSTQSGGVWSTNRGTIDGSGQLTSTSGIDTVSYTITNTCGTFVSTKVVTVTNCSLDVKDITNSSIKIYPNPTSDYINIDGNVNSILISDMIGKIVFNHIYNQNKVTINIIDLPQGIYSLMINGTPYEVIKR